MNLPLPIAATVLNRGHYTLHPLLQIRPHGVSQYTEDDALVARLRDGDNEAFRQLITRYNQKLTFVARAIIGDVFAEDVVQESWASIYRAIHRFEGRSSLVTWMTQIVSNEAKSRLRKEKRHTSVADIEGLEHSSTDSRFDGRGHWQAPPGRWELSTPDRMLEEDQLRHCIEHTLTVLPDNQKAVFMLRDLEQVPLSDIASSLDLSEANVRVLLHRARVKLMEVIDHYQETGEC